VSHDRYFVERLATKIVEVGDGKALLYPGTYAEFLWSKQQGAAPPPAPVKAAAPAETARPAPPSHTERKRDTAERRKRDKAYKALRDRIADLEGRIAEREQTIRDLEQSMAAPGFYEAREQAKTVIDQHQALMWEVRDLLSQWEMLQGEAEAFPLPNP
jgi:ATP-binding cassette, subfamily F, member 3